MIEIAWHELPAALQPDQPVSLTIGVFDGLHLGHRMLIDSITENPEHIPVVVTFVRHPTELLAAGQFPGFIMSATQKMGSLEALGVGVVVLIDFTREFSRTTGEEFLQTLLHSFRIRFAAIGHDFHCGRDMAMDGEAVRNYLRTNGVDVAVLPAREIDGGVVSSTRIRGLIRAGRLAAAARLLGRPYVLDLAGTLRSRDGDAISIPIVDGLLPGSRQIIPPPGEYVGWFEDANGEAEPDHSRVPLTIGEKSVRLPLAADPRIRYIVLQDNRVH